MFNIGLHVLTIYLCSCIEKARVIAALNISYWHIILQISIEFQYELQWSITECVLTGAIFHAIKLIDPGQNGWNVADNNFKGNFFYTKLWYSDSSFIIGSYESDWHNKSVFVQAMLAAKQ